MRSVLAVDLGGTKTASAVVSESGEATGKRRQPAARSLDESVAQIAGEAAAAAGVAAVGVIVPGIYDASSGRAWAPNLWGAAEVPLRERLERAVPVPVVIESDRAGYVAGEQWLGVARGLRDVVFVAIGTGIGAGIVAGGRVVSGAHGIAGAAGWSALDPRWKPEYEQAGCWESESAGPAVARMAGASTAEVIAAARDGCAGALGVLRHSAEYTGMGIANLISLLDPEMVVLGGGFLTHAADLLLPVIRESAARWAQPVAFRKVRIELSALGDDAGLMGAARLALLGAETENKDYV